MLKPRFQPMEITVQEKTASGIILMCGRSEAAVSGLILQQLLHLPVMFIYKVDIQ